MTRPSVSSVAVCPQRGMLSRDAEGNVDNVFVRGSNSAAVAQASPPGRQQPPLSSTLPSASGTGREGPTTS